MVQFWKTAVSWCIILASVFPELVKAQCSVGSRPRNLSVSGAISSLNYPSSYLNNADCQWKLVATAGMIVQLDFGNFRTESQFDFVTLYNGPSTGSTVIARLSGTIVTLTYRSTQQYMYVSFSSDSSVSYTGFTATFQSTTIGTYNCTVSPCYNGGTCVNGSGGNQCQCLPGYTGRQCESRTNNCTSSPCYNGATCVSIVNGYYCQCLSGYTGLQCASVTSGSSCITFPCYNSGTCVQNQCECQSGYTGLRCETGLTATGVGSAGIGGISTAGVIIIIIVVVVTFKICCGTTQVTTTTTTTTTTVLY